MKRIILCLSLSIAAAMVVAQPFSAYAEDNPNDKNKKPGKAAPAVRPVVQHNTVNKSVVNHNTMNKTVVNHNTNLKPAVVNRGGTNTGPTNTKNFRTTNNTTVNKSNIKIVTATTHTRQPKTWGGPKGGGKYTAANNYGGRWTAGNAHSDWNRTQVNVWNGHHYRWFNGGWLMIDDGFWPDGYYQYRIGGSKMANAQAELANMGYYNGPVNGVPDPYTRQAIANYQTDYNLPVTGHLNPPTQQALGLE